MAVDKKKPIGSILLRQKALSPEQLDTALRSQGGGKGGSAPLVSRLTEQGIINDTAALKALSEQSGCPGIDLKQICIRLSDLDVLPLELARTHLVLPVLVKGDRVFVAMHEPGNKRVLNEIEFSTGKKVFAYIALRSTLETVIAEAYELRDQGHRHYVGSRCPPETLKKVGVLRPPPPPRKKALVPPRKPPRPGEPREQAPADAASGSGSGALPEESFHPTSHPPTESPAVVVDDHLRDAVGSSALREAPGEEGADLIDFADPLFGEERIEDEIEVPSSSPVATGDERLRILVVDDEPEVRRMLVRLFVSQGYRLLEAANGEEALHVLRDDPPDLLILDAMLPKVHGFEIARRLKSSERYKHIPIIMVSAVYRGWRFAEDIKENYGVEGFIEKPFKMDAIVAAVTSALSGHEPKPSSDSLSEEVERHLADAVVAYKKGDFEAAAQHLEAGVRADPLAFKVHHQLGLLYGKLGRVYDAIQELETALSIKSDSFAVLKNLAVLYQNAGFRNKAIEMWERCLVSAPDEPTRETIKRHLVAVL